MSSSGSFLESDPETIEEIFKDYSGRRVALITALTTDADKFFSDCDPEKENLSLYGYPNEMWEVAVPFVGVPPTLPEPTLGINFARDGMIPNDWLKLIAIHCDSWLLSVAFYYSGKAAGLSKRERNRLFRMINDLPNVYEVVTGKPVEEVAETNPVEEEPIELVIDRKPIKEEPVELVTERKPIKEEPIELVTERKPIKEEPIELVTERKPIKEEPVELVTERKSIKEEPIEGVTGRKPIKIEPIEVVTERKPIKGEPTTDSGSKSHGPKKSKGEHSRSNAKSPDESGKHDEPTSKSRRLS